MLPGFDGPITSMAKVNILFLMGHLANVVMDFIAQNLSTSGLVVSAFFCGYFGADCYKSCNNFHKP
jgi:hypothetical protein